MKKLYAFTVVFVSIFCKSYAQEYRDYIWQLGHKTIGDTTPFSLEFDFKNGQLNINRIYRDWGFGLTNTSISDNLGNLLLSTNGCALYNGKHELLQNGDSLNPGIAFDTQCKNNNGYVVSDGVQFVNIEDSLIFLFHQGDQYLSNPTRVYVDKIYITSVRKTKDEYIIYSKNQVIISDSLARGIECVRKQDSGWWCITHGKYDNKYHIISISENGVDSIHVQSIGEPTGGVGGGQTVFSSDGTQFGKFTPNDQLFLFDFDLTIGALSNFRHIHVSDSGFIGGIAFSPNSQYLYVSSQFDLYQVDTRAEDVHNAVVHIDHYDGFFSPFPTTFMLMQLGPDCRIYMIPPNGADVMHVIHDPDLPGAACNFEQHGIQLPVYNSITLPSFPNYRLDIGPPCDPTITGIADALPRPDPVRIGPIPASDYLNVWWDLGEAEMMLFDIQGRRMLSRRLPAGMQLHRLDLDLPSGVYVYVIVSRSGERRSGKVVVQGE